MSTAARSELQSAAWRLVEQCEKSALQAELRLQRARHLLDCLNNGGEIGGLPSPLLDEDSARAARAAARVDVLIGVCYREERPDEQ